jgi:NAD(P)-dependent dehydrogenase (short-subunit alcohol dehydrogenase family)
MSHAILITGGASGIGLATASLFASRGAQVAATYLDDAQLELARTKLTDPGVLWVQADIRDRSSVHAMIDQVIHYFGAIDVLVNCASRTGMTAVAPFLDTPPSLLDDIVDTNLKGTFHVSQTVAQHMVRSHRGGVIIHIASVGAHAAQEHASVYCATKAAQVTLAKAMALELAPYGIRVNCISPGDVNTEASETIVQDLRAGGASGKYLRVTPLGRRGRPEEIAAAVAWIASPEASFITGADLLVDGGLLSY